MASIYDLYKSQLGIALWEPDATCFGVSMPCFCASLSAHITVPSPPPTTARTRPRRAMVCESREESIRSQKMCMSCVLI